VCDRSAEDAYSSAAPDPTFAFVEGLCRPTPDFVIAFLILITFYTLSTSLFCILEQNQFVERSKLKSNHSHTELTTLLRLRYTEVKLESRESPVGTVPLTTKFLSNRRCNISSRKVVHPVQNVTPTACTHSRR
jgi:hypothetical protein